MQDEEEREGRDICRAPAGALQISLGNGTFEE